MATTNENVNINLNLNAGEAMNSLKGMKREMRDLQDQMSAAGKSGDTQLFDKLQRRFAEMRNDIRDTSKAMNYLDPGELLTGYVKFGQGVTGAFTSVTAALSIFGSESETVQKIQKKSTEIIQLMLGLEQARQILIDKGGRAEIKQIIATTVEQYKSITARVTEALTIKTVEGASKSAAVAQRIWNAVVAANPVMLLVAAVAALATGIYFLTKSTEEDTETQKKNAEERQKTIDLLKEQENTGRKLYLQAEQLKLDLLDEGPVKKRAQLLLDYDKTRIEAIGTYTEELKKLGKTEYEIEEKTAIRKGELRAAYEKNLRDLNESIAKEATEAEKKRLEAIDKITAAIATQQENEKTAVRKKYEELISLAVKYGRDTTALRAKMSEELTALDQKYWEEEQKQKASAMQSLSKWYDDVTKENSDANKLKAEQDKKYYDDLSKRLEEESSVAKDWNSRNLSAEQKALNEKKEAIRKYWDERRKMLQTAQITEEEAGVSMSEIDSQIAKEQLKVQEDFEEESLAARVRYWTEMAQTAMSAVESIGALIQSNTDIQVAEIESADEKWNKAQGDKMTVMKRNSEIEKAMHGENSAEYIASLKAMQTADAEQIEHDKEVAAKRKAALKENAKIQYEIALASIVVNSAAAAIKAWTELPWWAAAIESVAVIAEGVTQYSKANTEYQKVMSMAQGGDVQGAPHSGGGVDINAEGGEFVVNKKSMSVPSFRNAVSAINQAGGGVPAVGAGAVSSAPSGSAGMDESVVRSIVAQSVSAIAAIPVVVSEYDITQAQRKVSVYESNSKY